MNAGQFARLVDAIEEESFSAQKLDVLRTAASDAWFTCDQVGEIIELFTFSNEKEAVKRLLSAR